MILPIRHTFGVSLFFLLLAVAGTLLLSYNAVQTQLSLEGRNLHSVDARIVNVAPERVVQLIQDLGGDSRSFVNLNESGTIRAFTAASLSLHDFPVSGTKPQSLRNGVALAGHQVETVQQAGIDVLIFQQEAYPLVGRLGTNAESLLASSVMIIDDQLFASQGSQGTVVLDGSDIEERLRTVAPELESVTVRSGATDRTNIDTVSPLLLTLGLVSVALGAILTGVILGSQVRQWIGVSFLLGRPPGRIFSIVHVVPIGCAVIGLLVGITMVLALPVLGSTGSMLLVMSVVCLIATIAFSITVKVMLPW